MSDKSSFEIFDKDADGCITKDEIALVMRAMGYVVTEKEAQEMGYTCADPERVTWAEYQNLLSRVSKPDSGAEKQIIEAFRVFDKNENGMISENDVRVIFSTLGEALTNEDINSLLALVAVDDQGRIKYADFIKAFMKH